MQAHNTRGALNGTKHDSAQRSRSEARNGTPMSRAEKFEDEKQRIVASCFGRKEADGSTAESYITHIRIIEDAASPSTPPPPNSAPENKKPRAIIVAVRKSGRVRLHKARENSNGTFQIGKTWVLDHLSAIESYTGVNPTTYEEQQRKEWAGPTGMLVTIQKPYFWQTMTSKEKDFFIGSLVKIYRKYTGGSEPQLTGFTHSELAEFSTLPHRSTISNITQLPSPRPSSSDVPDARPTMPDYRTSDPRSRSRTGLERRPVSSGTAGTRETDTQDHRSTPDLSVSDQSHNTRAPDPRARTGALRKESSGQASKPELYPSASYDDTGRTIATASSVESLQSKPEIRTPPPSFINSERFKSNGSYSPLSRAETPGTPPVPGPRSPERNRAGTVTGRQDLLPERRRPPLPANDPSTVSPLKTPSSGSMMPHDAVSPLEPQSSKPKGLADIIIPNSTVDYFPTENKRNEAASERDVREGQQDVGGKPGLGEISTDLSGASSAIESPADSEQSEESYRPGLGPMIKKKTQKSPKEISNLFRKAATAHNAFKPRAGGVADKIREQASSPDTPDGINGVFRAPPREPKTPLPQPTPIISVESPPITSPPETAPLEKALEAEERGLVELKLPSEKPSPEKKQEPLRPPEERRVRRPSNNSANFAKALGIEPSLLDGRTTEIETVLNDLGWGGVDKKKTFEDLHADIRRDLARVETGSWLGAFEQNDERIATVGRLLDKAIAECEELDGILTLYNVELGTLTEDVAYIEAQSQGLQVQTANQKLLHNELQKLLETITLSSSQLRVLKEAPIHRIDSIEAIEGALVQLYKAMLTIDPKIKQQSQAVAGGQRDSVAGANNAHGRESEISNMRAVQERRDGYRYESLNFIQRFRSFISAKFQTIDTETTQAIARYQPPRQNGSKIDFRIRDGFRADLVVYSPLVLFARDIDSNEWDGLLKTYEVSVKKAYQEEFRNAISSWRSVAKKPTGDEQDWLFTSQEKEKEADSLVARKLTVKRTKTLREGPRNLSGDKNQDGKMVAYEAFAGLLNDTTHSIFLEQNFVVEMFHLSSLASAEFPDLVTSARPETRRLGHLSEKRLFDPDRKTAQRLRIMIDDIFSSWPLEVQNAVDWVVTQDPLQGIGVMLALELRMGNFEDSDQEYLTQTLTQIHSRLSTRFDRFVEEQIRGIEDTKVKIKKRKGVIAFMKTFPVFAATVESMLAAPHATHHEIRQLTNDVYIKINKAMFESLKFIAKESPVVMAGQKAHGGGAGTGDAEDKEILNYHILLIENMNHYLEEVDGRSNPILTEWKETALKEMTEHLDLYLDAVVRRPLGKLLDFLESTESLMATTRNQSVEPSSIAERASHSRNTFRKLLQQFDGKETGRGVEALKKRVVKHFGEADDPGLSQGLIVKVLRECGERYASVWDRTQRVIGEVYGGELQVEWRKEEVQSLFRRI